MRVKAYPRLHVGLVDLATATPRSYGGGGLMIRAPAIHAIARPSAAIELVLGDEIDATGRIELVDALQRLYVDHGVLSAVTIRSTAPQHVGLGTKTAMVMAALVATVRLHRIRIDRHELQRLSGRGGASGIGVNGFFMGGFLADGGHAGHPPSYAPSSSQRLRDVPPVVSSIPIPEHWTFSLLLPHGSRVSGPAEVAFFRRATPTAEGESLRMLSLLYHGIAPAVAKADLPLLRASLQGINRTGFKRSEVDAQPSARALLEALDSEPRVASGMSSLGPLVFAIAETHDADTLSRIASIASAFGAVHTVTVGQNRGYQWRRS